MELAPSWLRSSLSSIAITSVLLTTAAIYLRGWYRLRRAGRYPISGWRLGAFIAGGFVVWTALSPLAGLDRQFLIAHMVEHLLLMTLAPPLLLLGHPQLCLERGLPQFLARSARLAFDWPPVEGLRRVFANPAVCFLSATAVLLIWHLPRSFDLAMRSDAWHAI